MRWEAQGGGNICIVIADPLVKQKLTHHCKAIILQLNKKNSKRIKRKKKKKKLVYRLVQ